MMAEFKFKNLSLNKDGMHILKYVAEECKGDAIIKSTICITMEDTETIPSESL